MQTIAASNFSRRLFAAFAVAFGLMTAGLLAAPAANAKIWFEGGVFGSGAVRGYDVVAYFTEGRPVEGDRKFTHS